MSFDLRQHIRDVLAETDEESLTALTKLVFDRTPRNAVREAYRQALTEMVRAELPRATRPDHIETGIHTGNIGAGPELVAGEGQDFPDTQNVGTFPGGGNVRNSRAARLRRARFSLSVCVDRDTYRPLLDCTADQLTFAADQRDQLAEENATAAERYRRLAKLMVEQDAETVADLSDEQIEELVEGLTSDG